MNKKKSVEILMAYISKYKLDGIFDEIINAVEIHTFEPGEMIVEESDDTEFYYLLVEGKAKVCPSSEDGKIALLDFLTPLDLLCEQCNIA